jgi:hypothetical protein
LSLPCGIRRLALAGLCLTAVLPGRAQAALTFINDSDRPWLLIPDNRAGETLEVRCAARLEDLAGARSERTTLAEWRSPWILEPHQCLYLRVVDTGQPGASPDLSLFLLDIPPQEPKSPADRAHWDAGRVPIRVSADTGLVDPAQASNFRLVAVGGLDHHPEAEAGRPWARYRFTIDRDGMLPRLPAPVQELKAAPARALELKAAPVPALVVKAAPAPAGGSGAGAGSPSSRATTAKGPGFAPLPGSARDALGPPPPKPAAVPAAGAGSTKRPRSGDSSLHSGKDPAESPTKRRRLDPSAASPGTTLPAGSPVLKRAWTPHPASRAAGWGPQGQFCHMDFSRHCPLEIRNESQRQSALVTLPPLPEPIPVRGWTATGQCINAFVPAGDKPSKWPVPPRSRLQVVSDPLGVPMEFSVAGPGIPETGFRWMPPEASEVRKPGKAPLVPLEAGQLPAGLTFKDHTVYLGDGPGTGSAGHAGAGAGAGSGSQGVRDPH